MEQLTQTLSKLESLLFIAHKPLPLEKIATLLQTRANEVENLICILQKEYEGSNRGVRILCTNQTAELVTARENFDTVKDVIDYEEYEMTRAKIETLAILAYQGPLSKAELENIRGVNCALILRNLKIDDLIIEIEENNTMTYYVSTKFLRVLGIDSLRHLPEYEALHQKVVSPLL